VRRGFVPSVELNIGTTTRSLARPWQAAADLVLLLLLAKPIDVEKNQSISVMRVSKFLDTLEQLQHT